MRHVLHGRHPRPPYCNYLLLNRAHHGAAGFDLGSSANFNAVLYDPTKPVHLHMTPMANTSIRRMYHPEAINLLNGRVLVSGSDPTDLYSDPNTSGFPEEYRVKVFTTPYLLSGLPRPAFSLPHSEWAYNASIISTLTSDSLSRVSLLSSVVRAHTVTV
jgi:hypothetical protein